MKRLVALLELNGMVDAIAGRLTEGPRPQDVVVFLEGDDGVFYTYDGPVGVAETPVVVTTPYGRQLELYPMVTGGGENYKQVMAFFVDRTWDELYDTLAKMGFEPYVLEGDSLKPLPEDVLYSGPLLMIGPLEG